MAARILTGLMLVVLAGCDINSNMEELELFARDAYRNHKPDIDPLPTLTPIQVFIYQSSGKTDPFDRTNLRIQKPLENRVEQGELAPDLTRRKEPLETFPLDSLELVGVMQQGVIDWGVIRAPNGTVHRVTEGNYIGENYGEVIDIEESRVRLVELTRDPSGQWKKRRVEIYLTE